MAKLWLPTKEEANDYDVIRQWRNAVLKLIEESSSGGTAASTSTDTTNFNNNLSSADTDVQKALDTLDDMVSGAWTVSGSNIYYNSGNVGVGTTTPLYDFHLEGIFYSKSSGWTAQFDALASNAGCFFGTIYNTGFTSVGFFLETERTANSAFKYLQFKSDRSGLNDTEFRMDGDGNGYCDGSWSGGGADVGEFFESQSLNLAIGMTVVLDSGYIRQALVGEEPIGVIRPNGTCTLVGNSDWNKWQGKYLRDDYGSYLTEQIDTYTWYELTLEDGTTEIYKPDFISKEDKEVAKFYSYESDKVPVDVIVPDLSLVEIVTIDRRVLNPNFDSTKEHTPRSERPEWYLVGYRGQIPITKGEVIGNDWIYMKDISNTVALYYVK